MLIAEGKFPVRNKSGVADCICRVTFDLRRKHSIQISCLWPYPQQSPASWTIPNGPYFVQALPNSDPIECLVLETNKLDEDGILVILLPVSGAVIENGSSIVRVNAGIINLEQYWFGGPHKLDFCLEDGTWIFEFTPVSEKTFLYPSEIQSESYSFTHHLVMRKIDGSAFSCAEARNAIDVLFIFLRFCTERWIAPALVVGIDRSGVAAMQEWGTPKVDVQDSTSNWLDPYGGEPMVEVFPEYSRLMEDSDWKEAIRTAIYWYIRANTNHVGPDGGIVLLQAALERLAWQKLVQDRGAISGDGFLKLPAADQMRLILDSCRIPLSIPALLEQTLRAAKEYNWNDGPQAFVEVRNGLVHPQKRKKLEGSRAYFEVFQLGKWYLELILLRMFGLNSKYANRLKMPRSIGDVDPVPWT